MLMDLITLLVIGFIIFPHILQFFMCAVNTQYVRYVVITQFSFYKKFCSADISHLLIFIALLLNLVFDHSIKRRFGCLVLLQYRL